MQVIFFICLFANIWFQIKYSNYHDKDKPYNSMAQPAEK
jgi:hypothetical protein